MKEDSKAVATFPQASSYEVAAQLTDQYRKAVAGTREVLVFGAMMMHLKVVLSRQNNSHGPQTKGDGLKGWIEENCPLINYKVAYGFYNLARGLQEALSIPLGTDIHRLLTAPKDSLSKKESKIREQIDGAISGKSARQLEFDFGIRWARPELPSAGGARPGAGRPPKSLSREQLEIEAFFSPENLGELHCAVVEKRWHLRLDDEKKGVLLSVAERLVEDLGGRP